MKNKQHKYKPFQKKVTLLMGMEDIMPYELILPEPPPIEQFVNYGLPPEEQFFQKLEMPLRLQQIDKAVKIGRKSREQAISEIEADKELCNFVQMVWLKRLEGDWQLINGVPIHISPTHWFYLNFWEMNIGLPDFRMDNYHYCTDLWFFAWWDYVVVPNPFCEGAIEFAMRQIGKSYKLGVILYEHSSRTYESRSGMQSKNNEDAAIFFQKCIVKPQRKLPFFFQPVHSHSTFPKSALEFTPIGKKASDAAIETLDNDELMGRIDFAASTVDAYDNATLDRAGGDEVGKTVEIDVYERYNAIRPAMRTRGGKYYATSTVEELTKRGGKYFKSMWDDSDRNPNKPDVRDIKVDENGETVSGLWPWFTPAYCTYSYDQYGMAIVDTINESQKAYVKSIAPKRGIKYWWLPGKEAVDKLINKQTDQNKQQDIIRKHPRSIREAFESSTGFCYFNKGILTKRLMRYTFGYPAFEKEIMKYGRFDWVDGVFGGDVEFVATDYPNARFHASMFPREGMRNLKVPAGNGKYKPANTSLFRSGADPFKYDTPDVKYPSKMSMGAQHIYAFHDALVDPLAKPRSEWLTNNIVYEYCFRPQSKDELFEDYLKACIFYGCKLYPEINNAEVLDYFRRHGFSQYIQLGIKTVASQSAGIVLSVESTGGNITNSKTIETMFRHVESFVNEDAPHCFFFRTLRQILGVERENLNPYDLFVSIAYTLMSAYDADVANKQIDQRPTVDRELLEAVYEREFDFGG